MTEHERLPVCLGRRQFSSHIGHIVSKVIRFNLLTYLLGLIKRSFVYEDSDIAKRLYTVLVGPHLKYSNTGWYPRFQKDN